MGTPNEFYHLYGELLDPWISLYGHIWTHVCRHMEIPVALKRLCLGLQQTDNRRTVVVGQWDENEIPSTSSCLVIWLVLADCSVQWGTLTGDEAIWVCWFDRLFVCLFSVWFVKLKTTKNGNKPKPSCFLELLQCLLHPNARQILQKVAVCFFGVCVCVWKLCELYIFFTNRIHFGSYICVCLPVCLSVRGCVCVMDKCWQMHHICIWFGIASSSFGQILWCETLGGWWKMCIGVMARNALPGYFVTC